MAKRRILRSSIPSQIQLKIPYVRLEKIELPENVVSRLKKNANKICIDNNDVASGGLLKPPSPRRKSRINIDLSNPKFKKPFNYGWVRALVYRSKNDNSSKTKADVYYYAPSGQKLRSSRELVKHLTGNLTLDNFSFLRQPMGLNDPTKEIVRDAQLQSRRRTIEDRVPPVECLSQKDKVALVPPKECVKNISNIPKAKAKPESNEFDKKRKFAGPDDFDSGNSPKRKNSKRGKRVKKGVETLTLKDKGTLVLPMESTKNISNIPKAKAEPESKEFDKKRKSAGPDDYDSRYSPKWKNSKRGKRKRKGIETLTQKDKCTLLPPKESTKNISNIPKAKAKPESKKFDKKRKSADPDDYDSRYCSEGKNSKRRKRVKDRVESLTRKDKVTLVPPKVSTRNINNITKAKATPESKKFDKKRKFSDPDDYDSRYSFEGKNSKRRKRVKDRVESLTRNDKVTLVPPTLKTKNITNMPKSKAKSESKEFDKEWKSADLDDYDSRYSSERKNSKRGKRIKHRVQSLARKDKVTLVPPKLSTKNITKVPKAKAKPKSKEFDKEQKSAGPDDYDSRYSPVGKNSKRGKRVKQGVESLTRKDKVATVPLKKSNKIISPKPNAKAKPKSKFFDKKQKSAGPDDFDSGNSPKRKNSKRGKRVKKGVESLTRKDKVPPVPPKKIKKIISPIPKAKAKPKSKLFDKKQKSAAPDDFDSTSSPKGKNSKRGRRKKKGVESLTRKDKATLVPPKETTKYMNMPKAKAKPESMEFDNKQKSADPYDYDCRYSPEWKNLKGGKAGLTSLTGKDKVTLKYPVVCVKNNALFFNYMRKIQSLSNLSVENRSSAPSMKFDNKCQSAGLDYHDSICSPEINNVQNNLTKDLKRSIDSSESASSPPKKKFKLVCKKSMLDSPPKQNLADCFMVNLNNRFMGLLHIFQHLDVFELLQASCVSKVWGFVASHPSLWKTVRLKNLRVTDWKGFARTLSRHNTQFLDLRNMLVPGSPYKQTLMWDELCEAVSSIKTLKKINLGHCSPEVFCAIAKAAPQLESIVSLSINKPSMGYEIDLKPLALCRKLTELKMKTLSEGLEIKELSCLKDLTNLKTLALGPIKNLNGIEDYLPEGLISLELGECNNLSVKVATITLPKLKYLKRLRLEKGQGCCPTFPLLEAIATHPTLKQLELINFDVKPGFEERLAKCTNLKILLIIPTYDTNRAITNQIVMDSVRKLCKTLNYFMWCVTLEVVNDAYLYMQQGDANTMANTFGDSILASNPSERRGRKQHVEDQALKVTAFPLKFIQRDLSIFPSITKTKILKVPFSETWRQTISATQF